MNLTLSTRDCIVDEKFIYYFASEIGWIIRIEKETGKLEYMIMKDRQRTFTADCCTCVRDLLYFLSVDGTCLLEYELKEKTCHIYHIACGKEPDENFLGVFPFENTIYIFPRYTREIVAFHCISKEFSVYLYPKLLQDIVFQAVCLQNERVWMFSEDGKAGSFDMKACRWEFFDMGMQIPGLIHAVTYQGTVYLLSRKGRIYDWEPGGRRAYTYEIRGDKQNNDSYIRMAFVAQNRCVLLPMLGDGIKMYDLNTRDLVFKQDIGDSRKRIEGREHWSAFRGYGEDSEWHYFVSHAYKEQLKISKHTGELYWSTPQYPSKTDWMKCRISSGEYIFYEGKDQLAVFAGGLQSRDTCVAELGVGRNIWRFCSGIT